MKRTRWMALFIAGAALLIACGGNLDTPTYSGDPPDACFDMADVVASAAKRCGEDYQTNYDSFIAAAANGSCNNITSVRDHVSLYSECMPWFSDAECSVISTGSTIPDSCSGQLLQ